MKKLLSLLLCAALLLACSATALAAGGTYTADGNVNTSISHTIAEPRYTVTIPATVSLGQSATVEISDAACPNGYAVEVTLSATSGADNAFTLSSDGGDTLIYTVTKDDTAVTVGDVIVSASTGDASAALTFCEPEITPNPGEYTGTVTFTVSAGLIQ